jgi:CHAT domain-containing protein
MTLSIIAVFGGNTELRVRAPVRAVAALLLVTFTGCRREDPVSPLARIRFNRRPVEARLSGGFAWAPPRDAGSNESRASLPIERDTLRAARRNEPAAVHAVALLNVLERRPRDAVAALSPLAAAHGEPRLWNDLAAARYAVAVDERRPEELAQALADVDAALRIDDTLPEARFNRALILEELGVRKPAISAWRKFLDGDRDSAWAREAQQRLRALLAPQPDFQSELERSYERIAHDPGVARALVSKFRQDARVTAETEILARWAEAMRAGDSAAAARHLAVAGAIGRELAALGGEQIVGDAVAAIVRSSADVRASLVEGHALLRTAQQTFRSGRVGQAEPMFRRARQELTAGGSPVAFVAAFFAAYMLYEQGKVPESTDELERLLEQIPAHYPTCRARVEWQLAICRSAQGRWGGMIDFSESSRANFERAQETYYAAVMREHAAEAYDMIGDPASSWGYRAMALQEIGKTSSRLLQAMLGFLTQEAILRRDWDEAASFAALELEVAKEARFHPLIADAHLRRARILHHFGDPAAQQEIARARITIASIPDAGMRARLDARRVAVEAIVATTPEQSRTLLTRAIDFHASGNGQRMFLPSLLLHRARVWRTLGEPNSARQDFDAAFRELESVRGSVEAAEQRVGVFESADAIVDDAIGLALEQRDVAGAFRYAERARARALLDALQARAAANPRAPIPENTAIIEYALSPARAVIFVADVSGIRVAVRPIDREELRARATSFAEKLARDEGTAGMEASLYRDLLAPVQPWITNAKTLVIVPDAATTAVPFAALRAPGGRFLAEKHTIRYAPSAAVYAQALARPEWKTGGERPILIVANSKAGDTGLSPLRRTAEEARRVGRQHRAVTLLADHAATRATFLEEAPRAGMIHFAGHALSSEYRPEDTALLLAGRDGRLRIAEIARLPLGHCGAVVLSACSTARGKSRQFEGNLSVARAFLAAGVQAVVATSWPIDDADAAEFFPRVHAHLVRGASAAEAVRAAQIESIQSQKSPSLWAAVQVMGH